MRKEKQIEFQNILDCFTGTDGGVKFFFFKERMEQIDKQALNGDKSSEELILVMSRFSKLIDVLTHRRQ
jgi:hypothetical protein